MNTKIRKALLREAERIYVYNDPAHDFTHALRVLSAAEMLQRKEGGDLEIIVPSAIFHDAVCYPKSSPLRSHSTVQSAYMAEEILTEMGNLYPKEKISEVKNVIKRCSFTQDLNALSIEEMIVRDADLLEATGAIEIMRMFSYSGTINRPFYDYRDMFAQKRDLDDLKFAIDLFLTKSYRVPNKIHTVTGKTIAERRVIFMKNFIEELQAELAEVDIP